MPELTTLRDGNVVSSDFPVKSVCRQLFSIVSVFLVLLFCDGHAIKKHNKYFHFITFDVVAIAVSTVLFGRTHYRDINDYTATVPGRHRKVHLHLQYKHSARKAVGNPIADTV